MEALRICYQMNNYQHVKRKIYLTHLKKTERGPHIFIVTIVTRKETVLDIFAAPWKLSNIYLMSSHAVSIVQL